MNLRKPFCRYPLAALALGLLGAGILWAGYFLATFDLNDYREQLSAKLAQTLEMPVSLGAARIELREGGIAFYFSDLSIGTAQMPVELHARGLWLQLAWHGLFLKKPILTEIALDAPRLRIDPADPAEPSRDRPLDASLLAELRVKRFEVRDGILEWSRRSRGGTLRQITVNDLRMDLAGFGGNGATVFDITGHVAGRGDAARLSVRGSLEGFGLGVMDAAVWDLALDAKALDLSLLTEFLPEKTGVQADGAADLALFLKGAPARGAAVQIELSGKDLRGVPGTAFRQPVRFRHLLATGTWQHQAVDRHTLSQVALQLDDVRLAGEFRLTGGDGRHTVEGTLANGSIPLDTLRRWLPPAVTDKHRWLTRLLPGGRLALHHAAFRTVLPMAPETSVDFSLAEAAGRIEELRWQFSGDQSAELTGVAFRLTGDRWDFEDGTLNLNGLPATFSAALTREGDAARLTFDAAADLTAERFTALRGDRLPANFSLAGPIGARGELTGTTQAYRFDVQVDLAKLDLRYADQFHLPPGPGSLLQVRGNGTSGVLAVEDGTFTLTGFPGRLTGNFDWSAEPRLDLAATLQLPDLTRLAGFAPAVEKLKLQGGARLDVALTGPPGELRPRLAIELLEAGVPARGIVADITRLNGRLVLEGKGLRGDRLTGRLGKSPVSLRAAVADLAQPRLELDVRAPAVRADELIFRSDRAMLRDIEGRLILDRDGLAFAPVKVRLDGGTRATVTGSVSNFAEPRVELDIRGAYARVDEIIALWTDLSPQAKAARGVGRTGAEHKPLPPIRITAEAESGDLYGMKFANARALIVPTSERLLIHPLDFNVGAGYCTAQVLVDHAGTTSTLRVSGHAEDVDAFAVYNELLDRKSIMRGSLRGDFYLQGELGGEGFLPASFGKFSVSVRNGVMRHSPVLSTIFSLLNVSQLFSFKLPDVNSEGVPFSRLTAELAFDKGVISSEQVVIDSEALNMVYVGNYDMIRDELDLLAVVKPLRTIDKVVTRLPIAGWILGGEEKALITAQFKVTGRGADPDVEAIPITAMSRGILGIVQRTLGLPLKLIEDPAILWGGGGEKR